LLSTSQTKQSLLQQRFATSPHPEVQAAAGTLTAENRVLSSIMATAHSHMSFLRGGPVQESVATSTVPLTAITDGTPLTLYLVLPPDKLVSHGRLLRLWLGVVLSLFARRKAIPPQPTLLLVDEAAQLGHLEPLLTAITLLRGYGVKVWSFWQDLAQLKTLYPHSWATLLNNCQVQQFFAPASPHAAAEIETYLAGSNTEPVAGLSANDVLVSRKGRRPRVLRRADYRRDVEFMGRFEPNPFYRHHRPAADPSAIHTFGDNVLSFPTRRPPADPGCTL
ncbi:MAG: type IV secretory system conjugative DNA transfer family protein, partial [Caldilineaceae bacterium]|nr:type IV secretory system conjugative DNA transfer family protein [Caldilineaceae bacterium]